MSLTSFGETRPSLAWTFESSNVDYVTNLTPSAQVSPGPAQLVGSAALVTNAPTSNTAVYFPGTTSTWMNLGTSTPVNFNTSLSNIFVECWVYSSRAYNPTFITWHQGASGGQENWSMYFDTAGTLYTSIWGDVAGTPTQGGTAVSSAIPQNTWTHVGFAIANTASVYKTYIYVNGAPTSTTPAAGWVPKFYAAGTTQIGGRNTSGDLTNMYIRDLRVVQGGVVPVATFTPLASAPFTYASPTYVANMGTTVFTLLGQFITYVPGKYGNAVYINNEMTKSTSTSNAWITYTPLSSYGLTLNNFSISSWIYPYTINTNFTNTFFNMSPSAAFYSQFLVCTTGSKSRVLNYTNGSAYGLNSIGNLPIGQWSHHCVTYSNVGVTTFGNVFVSYYINGVIQATSNIPQVAGGSTPLQFSVLNKLEVGSSVPSTGAAANSALDDLRIYNTALSAAQVQSIYQAQGMPSRGVISITTPGGSSLSGAPLFNQISQSAASSAVGAFSLRAVNGVTAKAVQVRPVAAFPPGVFTETSTVISALSYSQYLTGYPFGGTGVYTSNSSSGTGTSTRSWRAFDGITGSSGSRWVSGANYVENTPYTGTASTTAGGVTYPGEWLQIQLPQAIVLSSYSVFPQSTNYPATWNVFASNDGTTWDVIDQRGSQTLVQNQYNNYKISGSPASYSYYRMGCYITGRGTGFAVVEMKLYGSNASWNTDFYADERGNLLTAPVVGMSLQNWLGGATGYVTKWYDQSGKGNDASQNTAANQPIIQRATKGPGYMVNFNGTSQFVTLSASYDFLNGTNLTLNSVALRTATISGQNWVFGTNSASVSYQRIAIGFETDTTLDPLGNSTNSPGITIPAYSSGEHVYYMTGVLSPSRVVYSNDVVGGTNADTVLLSVPVGTQFSIGRGGTGGAVYYNGNLFELLIFTSALNQAQVTQIYQNQLSYTGS